MALRTLLFPSIGKLPRRLRPIFTKEATRVTIFAHAYNEIVPAEDLVLKYVASFTVFPDRYAELYVFTHSPNDVDAVMSVWKDPEGRTVWQVGRMAGATLDIRFDGELVKTFPQGTDIGIATWKG